MLSNLLLVLFNHQEQKLVLQLRTTSGRTLEGGETEFSLTTSSKQKAIELNEDFYLTAPAIVASAINETNEMSGSKSLVQTITIQDTNR